MGYRITAARVTNFKRVRDIQIIPDADSAILLIAGNNRQGKSSLLDALTAAFGGKAMAPTDPVRHGEHRADVEIVLDGGALRINRSFRPDGSSTLELHDGDGKLSSPQARIDKLVAGRLLDPHAFTLLPTKDQRARLLDIIDRDGVLAAIDERRARLFDKRTEVGRDLKRAEGELERHGIVGVGQPIDVAALSAERAATAEQQRQSEGLNTTLASANANNIAAQSAADQCAKRIRELEYEIEKVRQTQADHEKSINAALMNKERASQALAAAVAAWNAPDSIARRVQVDADLARANEHNRAVFSAEAGNARQREAAATVKQLDDLRTEQTRMIDKIDEQKLAFLAAAKLPVDGLGVDGDGITFNGVPFAQASGAEKLRVALAIAVAASPNLDDVWIRDGALLDDESLQLVEDFAKSAGRMVWIERVGTNDHGAIVIQDGEVRQ